MLENSQIIENTQFIKASLENGTDFDLAFIVLDFRTLKTLDLDNLIKIKTLEAQNLASKLPIRSNKFLPLLWKIKQEKYTNRNSYRRQNEFGLSDIIRTPKDLQYNQDLTLSEAWSIVMLGNSIALETNKKIKKITFKEKIRKIKVSFILALQDLAEA